MLIVVASVPGAHIDRIGASNRYTEVRHQDRFRRASGRRALPARSSGVRWSVINFADGSSAIPKMPAVTHSPRCPAVIGRPMSDLGVDGAFAQQRRDRWQRQVRHDVSVPGSRRYRQLTRSTTPADRP
jgi:hypothetical protein